MVSSVRSEKMNEMDIAALNKAVQLGRCWQGVILCPYADGSGAAESIIS